MCVCDLSDSTAHFAAICNEWKRPKQPQINYRDTLVPQDNLRSPGGQPCELVIADSQTKKTSERITGFTYLSFMVDGYRDVSTSDCKDARTKGRDSDWCVHMTTSKNLSYFVAQSVVISLKFSVIWVIIHWEQAYFIPKHVFLNLTECFSCWNPSRHWQKTEKKQRVDSVIIGPKQDVITCLLM